MLHASNVGLEFKIQSKHNLLLQTEFNTVNLLERKMYCCYVSFWHALLWFTVYCIIRTFFSAG